MARLFTEENAATSSREKVRKRIKMKTNVSVFPPQVMIKTLTLLSDLVVERDTSSRAGGGDEAAASRLQQFEAIEPRYSSVLLNMMAVVTLKLTFQVLPGHPD